MLWCWAAAPRERDEDRHEVASQDLLARPPEALLRLRIPVGDDAVAVEGDERVVRRLEDQSGLALAGLQRDLDRLAFGDVARGGVHQPLVRRHDRVPVQPPVAAVLGLVAVDEAERDLALGELGDLAQRRRAVVGVHHVEERARHELLGRPAEDVLERGVDALEVPVEARRDGQVARELEVPGGHGELLALELALGGLKRHAARRVDRAVVVEQRELHRVEAQRAALGVLGELLDLDRALARTQVALAPCRRALGIEPRVVAAQQHLTGGDPGGGGTALEPEGFGEAGVVEQVATVQILDVDERHAVVDDAAQHALAVARHGLRGLAQPFGLPALGHVDRDAEHPDGFTAGVALDAVARLDPSHLPVGSDDAVCELDERRVARQRRGQRAVDPLAVARIDAVRLRKRQRRPGPDAADPVHPG